MHGFRAEPRKKVFNALRTPGTAGKTLRKFEMFPDRERRHAVKLLEHETEMPAPEPVAL